MERRLAIRNMVMTAAACLLPDLRGQEHAAPSQDFVIHSDVRLVLLDVSVKDPDGAFVEGLGQSNFEVFENNVRQTVSTFSNTDLPFTVGILVDESRSMAPKRNDVLAAAGLFIAESNPHDEIFVLNFNDTVKRGLPPGVLFSDDMAQLRAALGRSRPQGMTALNDAVVEGLKQLELGRRDKKGLIVVSDGVHAAPAHDPFGDVALAVAVSSSRLLSAQETVRHLIAAMHQHHRDVELDDDAVVVCLDWNGRAE